MLFAGENIASPSTASSRTIATPRDGPVVWTASISTQIACRSRCERPALGHNTAYIIVENKTIRNTMNNQAGLNSVLPNLSRDGLRITASINKKSRCPPSRIEWEAVDDSQIYADIAQEETEAEDTCFEAFP